MMLVAATEAFAATCAYLECNTDSFNWLRVMLRVLSVLVVLASATRYIFFHKRFVQKEIRGVKEAKPTSPTGNAKKKKSVSDDVFDSDDDVVSTSEGSTATSDDELDDSPSYSRTVMMNYRAYCMACPASNTVATSIRRMQGLTVKDERFLKSGRSNTSDVQDTSVRQSDDNLRWECLRGSPGRTQVKKMDMPPGLEEPEALVFMPGLGTHSVSLAPGAVAPSIAVSDTAAPSNDGRPWRTKAKSSSPLPLSSSLLNPISGGLRPQRKV